MEKSWFESSSWINTIKREPKTDRKTFPKDRRVISRGTQANLKISSLKIKSEVQFGQLQKVTNGYAS